MPETSPAPEEFFEQETSAVLFPFRVAGAKSLIVECPSVRTPSAPLSETVTSQILADEPS